MRSVACALQERVDKSVTTRTYSPAFDPSAQLGFMQIRKSRCLCRDMQ